MAAGSYGDGSATEFAGTVTALPVPPLNSSVPVPVRRPEVPRSVCFWNPIDAGEVAL